MWILLNNHPINLFEEIRISNVYFVNCSTWREEIKEPDYYYFEVHLKNKEIYSKHYKTKEEAEEARDNLLLQINKTLATLPKVEI